MHGLKSNAAVFKSWIQIRIRIEPEPKNCAWLQNRNFEKKDNIKIIPVVGGVDSHVGGSARGNSIVFLEGHQHHGVLCKLWEYGGFEDWEHLTGVLTKRC